MELTKKNIHMDRMKCKAATQITLEDDIIVSDSKPDVDKLIFDKGVIRIEEVKATQDHVTVKGKLCFYALYLASDGDRVVNNLEGCIPFEEQVYMAGIESGDNVILEKELDDLTIGLINPRKLSVQTVISLQGWVDELVDIETGIDVETTEPVECKKKQLDVSEIVLQKRDIFRLKQEIEIPQNLPNVFCTIWDQVKVEDVQFKLLDDKISVQGDLKVFVLYEGEGEEQPIRWYETTVPFSGAVDCYGARDKMVADIDYVVDHADLEVRPDFDGEERMICVDLVLDLCIKLYEDSRVDIISDMYGIQKEIIPICEPNQFKCLLMKNTGKTKISEHMKIKPASPKVLQICNNCGESQVDDVEVVENGILVTGSVFVKILYVTSDDTTPFYSLRGTVPFTYTLDAPGINEDCLVKVNVSVEQMNTTMIDSEELEVKLVLCFEGMVFKNLEECIITGASEEAIDLAKLNNLPSMVVYVAKQGDTIWDIGKKYYIPLSEIKETNGITGEIKTGDKVLVLKSMNA